MTHLAELEHGITEQKTVEALTYRNTRNDAAIAVEMVEDMKGVIAAIRSSRRTGFLPLTTIQNVRLQVGLEELGRVANFLADDLRKEGRAAR